MRNNFIFSSESVTEGHPDKLCDQVSDAIVDHFLVLNPLSRIVAECAVSTGVIFIAARFASSASLGITEVAREVINEVGYDQGLFNARDCTIMTNIQELGLKEQMSADEKDMDDKELGKVTAGHQVTAFGYACQQTETLMPLPISLAHRLSRRLASIRKAGELGYLTPDGSTSVAIEYRNRKPRRIHSITILASQSTVDAASEQKLKDDLMDALIQPVFANEKLKPDQKTEIFINPAGPFIGGGPAVHAGLTGRKNAVDTYGLYSRNSAAALSGKDPSRVDRIGSYAARYVAKNIVAAGLADECEIALSYSIGKAKPISIQVETFGTGTITDDEIAVRIEKRLDLRVGHVIRKFNLRYLPSEQSGFYRKIASYGQVGRTDLDLPWEQLDITQLLSD
jgi:S-adenosylmethionine synthetase